MGYYKSESLRVDEELKSIEGIEIIVAEYNRLCEAIYHYENYEPDQFEMEQGDWRSLAKDRVEAYRHEREILKDRLREYLGDL